MNLETALSRINKQWPRNSKLRCPLHADKTPSLHLYKKTDSWTCFSCGANGDAFGLIAAFTGEQVGAVLRREAGPQTKVTAPKADPYAIRHNIFMESVFAMQHLYETIRHSGLEVWQRDLLIDRADDHFQPILEQLLSCFPHRAGQLLTSLKKEIARFIEENQIPTKGDNGIPQPELEPEVQDNG